MLNGTWVLVADACRARIFSDPGLRGDLVELEDFASPACREHVKDRVSDRSGQKPGGGQGGRVSAAQEVDPKESEARAFARHLAEVLKRKQNANAFKELVIAAPPHFLGLLRSAFDETIAKAVVASFDKDYTMLDAGDLSRRIHSWVR